MEFLILVNPYIIIRFSSTFKFKLVITDVISTPDATDRDSQVFIICPLEVQGHGYVMDIKRGVQFSAVLIIM